MNVLEALKNNGFETIDYIVVLIYIVILVGLGLFVSRSKKGQDKSSNDYFLAGNTLTWWAVGASLIAANISAEQFIGMSGSAYVSGIAMAAYELEAALALIIVGKFLLPLMIKKGIFTIPQFLSDRYNWGVGLAFSIFWLFLYVFINLTSVAWLGAIAIKMILGLPDVQGFIFGMEVDMTLLTIILILFVIAGIYSIYGGLASVAWTDVMQVTFLVGGGLITAYFALDFIAGDLNISGGALGALGKIYSELGQIDGDKHFNLVVNSTGGAYADTVTSEPYFDIPGIVVIVGALWLTNLGYWGFNQYIIQKGLAAKNLDEAKKGMVFAGFLKILIPFIVCIPGVCAFYIVNQQPELYEKLIHGVAENGITRPDQAYPFLIHYFTPTVVKGLAFAALAAAVISSLASMFNSTSTIFTMDIYRKFINKNATDKKLVTVGRITSLSALIIAFIAVYPIMGGADQAFQVIQEYSGFVYPGIVVIFGLGLLWKRSSGTAAVVAAIGTFLFSIIFKFALPEVPFLIRMGYVFLCLVALFIPISMMSKKTKPAEVLSADVVKKQLKWSSIMLCLSVITLIAGIIMMMDENCRNYGAETIFFLTVMFFTLFWYLRSNAKDKVEDVKSIGVDIAIFKTNTVFNVGAIGIIVILAILYICLW